MNMNPEIREGDLHAFIDGELDAAERARIAAIVEANDYLRDRVARYQGDKARLNAIYGGGMGEPLPMHWGEQIEEATRRPRWRAQSWGVAAMAASFVLVFVGLFAWRKDVFEPARDDVVADALAARAGIVQPVSVVPAAAGPVAAEARVMTAALDARVRRRIFRGCIIAWSA